MNQRIKLITALWIIAVITSVHMVLMVVALNTSPEPVLTIQGSTLPISEPTGKTYNPQQTVDGKTLQGSEL